MEAKEMELVANSAVGVIDSLEADPLLDNEALNEAEPSDTAGTPAQPLPTPPGEGEMGRLPPVQHEEYPVSPQPTHPVIQPSSVIVDQPAAADASTEYSLEEPFCSFCCIGPGGLRLPRVMMAAWKIGFKRIASTGDIGNWPRYTFLVVQSLLLYIGIIVSFAAPFDDDVAKYLRVSTLLTALIVNLAERALFWCVHAFSDLRDDGTWNFCADIVRLLVTDFFIYIGLMTAIYTTSVDATYYDNYGDDYFTRGYSMAVLIGLAYFLTAFVMKIFIAVKVIYSLLKARTVNNSNAATSQKFLLLWLCIFTCALSTLQILLVVFVILSFHNNYSEFPDGFFTWIIMVLGSFVPVSLCCLYFLHVIPWARFLPLSMALDLPPTANCPEEIDVQVISQQFQPIHREAMSCGGSMMSLLRQLSSPLFVITHFLFIGPCVFLILALVYDITYLSYDFVAAAVVGSIAFILLSCLSLPAIIWGLTIMFLIPVCPFFYPLLCVMVNNFRPQYRFSSATDTT